MLNSIPTTVRFEAHIFNVHNFVTIGEIIFGAFTIWLEIPQGKSVIQKQSAFYIILHYIL